MTTSVKIGDAAKDRLEELRAEIRLETGRSVTQQELLDRLIDRQFDSKDEILDSYRDEWAGLSEGEIERWLSGTVASGDPIEEDDVDRIVYGEQVADELQVDE